MRPVKRVLLGSAAGVFAVAGAQAADLPVKAQPVEYVRVCSLYGAGYWYVPGTDTCIKIGAFVRLQAGYGAGGGGNWMGSIGVNPGESDFSGAFSRTTSMFNFQTRGAVSFDMRTQTEYGTLRSYLDIGASVQSNAGGYAGGATTQPLGASQQYGNTGVYMDRAFLQFAGFTAGRIRSFFDMVNPGAYSLSSQRFTGDTSGVGITGIAYTWQFGGGLSASLSLEDSGWGSGGRGRSIINLAGGSYPIGGSDASSAFGLGIMWPDNKGQQFFDPVFNIRLDQSWGFIGASFALHDASGGYYGSGYNCFSPSPVGVGGAGPGGTGLCGPNNANADSSPPLNPDGTVNRNYPVGGNNANETSGHPADKWGWASSLGFVLVNPFGFAGDSLGVQGVYSEGAIGYNTTAWGPALIYGAGRKVGMSYLMDGVFDLNTAVQLTKNWSAVAYYEHVWNPQWRTSIYGGLLGTDLGSGGKALICPLGSGTTMPVGFSGGLNGVFQNSNYPAFTTPTPGMPPPPNGTQGRYQGNVSNCDPNSSWAQLGTRTMWNPVPDVDVGFDLTWVHLNTAFAGTANLNAFGTIFQQNATGRPPGAYNITDQNVFAGVFRIQRNFLY
jgi:Porin subfamily